MGYRDELEAAQARIQELEAENGRLKEQKAPDEAAWKRHWRRIAVVSVLNILATGFAIGGYYHTSRPRETTALNAELAELLTRRDTLYEDVSRMEGIRTNRRRELDEVEDQLRTLRASLRGLEAGHAEATLSPMCEGPATATSSRAHRLTDAELAARLALCTPYDSGDPGEYPYAEGIVVRRESEIRGGLPTERFIVRIPGRDDETFVVASRAVDFASASPESLVLGEFHQYRFWSRVAVGDILGVTWHVEGGRSTIFAVRITDK